MQTVSHLLRIRDLITLLDDKIRGTNLHKPIALAESQDSCAHTQPYALSHV